MIRIIILSIAILYSLSFESYSENKVYIEVKIENEIITNQDIINEGNYLVSLNENLKELPKSQLKKIARNSIIREKIKKIELSKYFDFEKVDDEMDKIIANVYAKLNFKNKNQFKNHLSSYDLKLTDVKEKLKIEYLWNRFIYKRYKDKISIDEKKIYNKIESLIRNNKIIEYNLSEILFDIKDNQQVKEKYKKILASINESGFKNTANIYGISDSAKYGGEIGWVKKTELTKDVIILIDNLNSGEISKPIQTSNGFLILKLNEKRESEIKINKDQEFKKIKSIEVNRKLQQYSIIEFNRVKQKIFFSNE